MYCTEIKKEKRSYHFSFERNRYLSLMIIEYLVGFTQKKIILLCIYCMVIISAITFYSYISVILNFFISVFLPN